MKRTLALLLTLALLFITARRLPAPFSEEPEATPTPKPKREATPRPKPKPKPEATSKPAAAPNRSFAGTWTGTTINKSSNGISGSTNYIVKISDDEKTVLITWSVPGTNTTPYQAACTRFGNALSWSLKQMGENPQWSCTDTFQLNSNGTASYVSEVSWIAGDNAGITSNATGTFSRQGAASVPPVPQTPTIAPAGTPITTAAPRNAGGLPVAKAVPGKPGFVYNPFDPNSRFLLDVRGKASGTKLIEPKSGKLFVVP
jgi:hypothetical protein